MSKKLLASLVVVAIASLSFLSLRVAHSFGLVTGYKTTLSVGLSDGGSETTVTVSSLTTRDSHTLDMTDIGDIGFIVINPGASTMEILSFTGITTSTKVFTGVTRGLPFYGTSTARVAANVKSHGAGETVVITDNHQWFTEQLVNVDDTQAIKGLKTFPTSTAAAPRYGDGVNLSGFPTSTFGHLDYINSVASSGAADATEGIEGVVKFATIAETAAGTATSSGAGFGIVPQNKYFSATSTATTTIPVTMSNGQLSPSFISTSSDYTLSGNNAYTGTSTFSGGEFRINNASNTIGSTGATTTFRGTLVGISGLIAATTTSVDGRNSTASTTVLRVTIPQNILVGDNVVKARLQFGQCGWSTGGLNVNFTALYGSSTINSLNWGNAALGVTPMNGTLDVNIFAAGASASQRIEMFGNFYSQPSSTGGIIASDLQRTMAHTSSTGSTSATSSQVLHIIERNSNMNASDGCVRSSYTVEAIVKE